MTGVIATIPRNQFLGALGEPLDSYKLYTYLAGSTTPVATFQDQALTTKNQNPIVLDATGSCSIWLDPAVTYKFVLKSPLGVTQPGWPVDNVSGASTEVSLGPVLRAYVKSADISAPDGAGLVVTRQSGVGAQPRTSMDKLRESLSVMDYMTDAERMDVYLRTAQLDVSGAIAKTIAAARSKAGNTQPVNQQANCAVILFPPGWYNVAQKVLVPMNMTFRGDGATVLCRNGGPTFETGYYVDGVLTSNMGLSDADAVANVLSGVRFEKLNFFGGDTVLNLRCAVWQSGVFNCTFYKPHIAITAKQCFYATYDNVTIRGDNDAFADKPHAIRLQRASNRVLLNNISIAGRSRGIVLGEAGAGFESAQIVFSNSAIETCDTGLEFAGTIQNFHAHDIYFEEVSNCFMDADGALKYNFRIHDCYSYSTSFFTDLSGLRDSFIGAQRDWSALKNVKAAVRLRQGAYGNQAVVELSNFGDADTGSNRYQLSDGVMVMGTLSKYTSGSYNVLLNQNLQARPTTSQYASQLPVIDNGWYGEAASFIIGTVDGKFNPVAGTQPYVVTKFYFSEYTGIQYAIKVTPNAGSGAGGTTPAPIFLKGIALGSHATQIVGNSLVVYSFRNGTTGTFQLAFGEFGTSNADPAFAWMRNGQFTAEGIVKLIA